MIDLRHLPGADLHEQQAEIHRRHVLSLVPNILITALIVSIPLGTYAWLSLAQPDILASETHLVLFVLAASAFFLFGWVFCFVMFMDYWLDVFILTEKRLIDIDQTGLFSRTVSELRLYRIQDVTAEIRGFWQSMFDFGSVYIQTAGEKERFDFQNVAHPNALAKKILELAEADRRNNLEAAVEEFSEVDEASKRVARKMES
jgi:uncharacterized membrane protein YdbT with pleckstrin-like domain